jgi:hypothetical protein
MSSPKIINIVGFLAIIVAIYFGYQYWNTPPATPESASLLNGGLSVQTAGVDASSTDDGRHIQSGSISEAFLTQLNLLSNVSFANSIFTDPVFRRALEDFDKPIPEKAVGRVNPFAAVSAAERAAKPEVVSTNPTSASVTPAVTTTATSTRLSLVATTTGR